MLVQVGPFTLTGHPTDQHATDVAALLRKPFPWHTILGTVLSIQPGTGWPVTSHRGTTIHMPPVWTDWRSTLAHETGHVLDLRHLTDDDRHAIHAAMHQGDADHLSTSRRDMEPGLHTWGRSDGLDPRNVGSEAFAEWVRWRLGQTASTGLGPHTWRTEAQQHAIEEVVMAAAERADVFTDQDNIADAHRNSVLRLAGLGIFTGTASGNANPQGVVTREQMASFLCRLLDHMEGN